MTVSMQESRVTQWQTGWHKTSQYLRGKSLIFLFVLQHTIFVLYDLIQVSWQWDRWEAETSKKRLSLWYLQPTQKQKKALIKAWILCFLSPFAYWEYYFFSSQLPLLSFIFLEFLTSDLCLCLNFPYSALVCRRKLHWFYLNWLLNW